MDARQLGELWQRTLGAGADVTRANPDATYKATLASVGAGAGPLEHIAVDGGARYQMKGELGRGGMGVVYRAEQVQLGREVALKKALATEGEGTRGRFFAEAVVTGRLEHPNIVPVYDLLTDEAGEVALAMKLVRGRAWKALLHPASDEEREAADGCDLEFHLGVLQSVANAVAFAHSRGLVHNDLKPANVMVGEFGEVLVMDWGVALDITEPRPAAERAGVAPHRSELTSPCGTPSYMAPELAIGDGASIGPWTDVYLLGAILYEIVTGNPPHDGGNMVATLLQAYLSAPPPFPAGVPEDLQAICRRAMARDPKDRYPTVPAFQEALRGHLRHRESLAITKAARETLARAEVIEDRTAGEGGDDARRRNQRYADFAEAAAGFRQALLLWPDNGAARAGAEQASLSLARLALGHGDLGLAEAQAARLDPESQATREIVAAISRAAGERRHARRNARILRFSLAAAIALVIGTLATGMLVVRGAERRASQSARLAEARLADIRRLADIKRLADYRASSEKLWPALPEKVPAMEAWLASARALAGRRDGHRKNLSELRAAVVGRAPTDEEQWEMESLAGLVAGLEEFGASGSGAIASVERRLEFARTITARTIEEHRADWERAAAEIADTNRSPAYRGLRLAPQLGLIPLGRDPASGLWEFAHLQTGAPPARASDGRLEIGEGTGLVFVLLPGGGFAMGDARPSPSRRSGANVDPQALPIEGPVHAVTLAPFFLSKYEMTQAQWQRIAGTNPSAWPPGRVIGGKAITAEHPVEQIFWKDAAETLDHLGLRLPTEAEWEYAARGGTTTPWWTGETIASLQGAANLADRYCQGNGGPGSWVYELALDDGYVVHAPVGRFRANHYGLHDLAGNVWEWCQDRYGPYTLPVRAGTGERIVTGDAPRAFRGGGFRSSAVHARSADRYGLYAPDYRGFDVGVRPARALQ